MGAVDTSEESLGTRGKRRRVGDPHQAFVVEKEVVKDHAHKKKHVSDARWNAANAPGAEGADAAISGWIAEERNRLSGRKLTEEEEKLGGARRVMRRGGYLAHVCGTSSTSVVDTRWAPTWKLAAREKDIQASSAAKGYRGPDLREGIVETSGGVSIRSSHLRVISLGALKKNGFFGFWTSRMLVCGPMALIARYVFALLRSRAPMALAVLGNCALPRMV